MLNPEIFRAYDIRGIVDKDIDEEGVVVIGKAFGTYLEGKGTITVGGDIRTTTPKFKEAFIKGITSTGVNVIDVGICSTPALYFSIFHHKSDGGAQITASHNPKEYNGCKLCINEARALFGDEIQEIREIAEKGEFVKGKGKIKNEEIVPAYQAMIKSKIGLNPAKKLKVVIDSGNGCAGVIAPKIIKELGCEVIELFSEPDGNFPNHLADPTRTECMQDLIKAVKENKADMGIGYDGDADRIGLVDEQGNIIWGDTLLGILAKDLLKRAPASKIIFEVKCSMALQEYIQDQGGHPIMWKTGHSFIKAKLKEEQALLAGEMSGHLFFAEDYYGFDDAIYASCKFLEILSNTDMTLSQMAAEIPSYSITPELRIDCPDNVKFEIVKKVKEELKKDYETLDIDGVRATIEDGWVLVRASNTSPKLIVRAEAKTKDKLDDIKGIILKILSEFKEIKDNLEVLK
ncbi:phosphomannomutase/phosphoglucomutase [Nanoarchaeota archaeon]